MNKIKNILLYFWQLPQNILGLVVQKFYKSGTDWVDVSTISPMYKELVKNNVVIMSKKMKGGISLGKYIVIAPYMMGDKMVLNATTLKHEQGHTTQSEILGPLYLIVIGLPSILHAGISDSNNYYKFYTEAWADKLAGIKRN